MYIIKKKVVPALLVGALTTAMIIPSYTTSRKPIKSIILSMRASIVLGTGSGEEEIEIEASNSRFSVDGYDILNDDFEWRDDLVPKIRTTLIADDDCYFQSFLRDKVTLKGGVQFLKASREDSSPALSMDTELPPLPTSIRDVENLKLFDNGTATWDPISAAESYKIRVYEDDEVMGSAVIVNINTSNYRDRITRGDTSYTVEVRMANRFDGGGKGNQVDPANVHISSDQAVEFRGNPTGEGSVWAQSAENGRWQYDNGDGTYPANSWKQIEDKWYFFDARGYVQTGWIQWEDKGYYCSGNSDMLTNCMMADNY